MANEAPNANTFNLDPPRRPGLNDFNGIAKVNQGGVPVSDPTTHPSAEEWNTICHAALAAGKVEPLALVVINGSATPTVQAVLAPGSGVLTSSFTLTRVSAGRLQLKWATTGSQALPASACATVSTFEDVAIDSARIFPWAGAGAGFQGYEIKTSIAGVGTDVDVVIGVY